jgi:hypothetical protein
MITGDQIKDALAVKLKSHWHELLDEEGRGAAWMFDAANEVIDRLFAEASRGARLVDLKDAIRSGRFIHRAAWSSYAAWKYDPAERRHIVGRAKAEWFWREVIGEQVTFAYCIPITFTLEDLDADDWRVL